MRHAVLLIAAVLAVCAASTATAASSSSSDEIVIRTLMQRFGVTRDEIQRQVSAQKRALEESDRLSLVLGDRFSGSWYDQDTRRLFVAMTHDQGSVPYSAQTVLVPVERSLQELKSIQRKFKALNALAQPSTLFHRTWIDYRANQVVAETTPELLRLGEVWLNPDFNAQGFPGTGRCSIGFAVNEGFITAAHCGTNGDRAVSSSGQLYGSVLNSTLPAQEVRPRREPAEYYEVNDVALVGLSGWSAKPQLYPYSSPRYITGASDGMVGQWVCRYGFRTGGPHCGSILSYNNGVSYGPNWWGAPADIHNLVYVSACGDRGDSGGPLVIHDLRKIYPGYATAVGMLAAGGGNYSTACDLDGEGTARDHTYYSMVSWAVSDLGVTLKLAGQ
jgi:streptogrisin C